jgi:hypothetical protein
MEILLPFIPSLFLTACCTRYYVWESPNIHHGAPRDGLNDSSCQGTFLDFSISRPYEVVLVGDPDTQTLINTVYAAYLPNKVVAGCAPYDEDARLIPLLADRPKRDGRATAYVCESHSCQNPTTGPEGLR